MRLQRYILKLLIRNFLFLLLIITVLIFLVVMGQSLRLYQNVGLGQLLERFPYLLPPVLILAVPVALLVATLLTYGRLSSDNEIMAIRMGGVHPLHAVLPAIVMSLLMVALNLYVSGTLAPQSSVKARQVTKDDLRNFLESLRAQRVNCFSSRQMDISWREVDEEDWLLGFYFNVRPKGDVSVRGDADRARITRDEVSDELRFELRDVTIAVGEMTDRISAPRKVLSYPISSLFGASGPKTRKSLFTNEELRFRFYRDPLLGWPDDSSRIVKYRIEYWSRIALSFASLMFALVGAPLGILVRRGSILLSTVVALGMVFVVYYPLHEVGKSLAEHGSLSPPIALFLPGAVLCLMGVILLTKVSSR